jgi:hypothetical protein
MTKTRVTDDELDALELASLKSIQASSTDCPAECEGCQWERWRIHELEVKLGR